MKRLFLVAALAAITSGALAQDKSYTPEAFLKKHPTAKSIGWKGTSNQIIIRLKSGKTETYNLADAAQKAAAEAKWGRLPAAPPPPPKVDIAKVSAPPKPATPPEPPVPAIEDKQVASPPPAVAPPPPPPPPKVNKKGQRVYS